MKEVGGYSENVPGSRHLKTLRSESGTEEGPGQRWNTMALRMRGCRGWSTHDKGLNGNNGRFGWQTTTKQLLKQTEKGMPLRQKENGRGRTVPESHLHAFPSPSLKPEWLGFQSNPLWSGQSALRAQHPRGCWRGGGMMPSQHGSKEPV